MIFAIKRFETHDGDGIRTTLFFKGCPLRCKWCHNPESISQAQQIAFFSELCINCGGCASLCEANTIEGSQHVFKREKCTLCGKCTNFCPKGAFVIYGNEAKPQEIAEELLKDEIFFKGSKGGVTFSGGEPLYQVDLCVEIAKILKGHGINIAIDTCGFVSKAAFDKILPYVDMFLYDIKAYDNDTHIKCTGRPNQQILENLQYLDDLGKEIEIRIPYVPGYNDDQIELIAKFLSKLKHIKRIRVLPYHNYADEKYRALDIKNTLPDRLPTAEELENAKITIKNITNFDVLS